MKRLMLFLAAIAAYGQTLGVTCPNGVQRPGTDVVCSLVLTNGTTSATAAQWQTTATGIAGVTVSQAVAGTAGAAGKSVTCNLANFCTAWANNQTAIANGQVATITLGIPAAATGTVTVGLASGPLGSTAIGDKIVIIPNPPVTVSVLSKCDINGDGLTNGADVTAYNAGILAASTAIPDLDGDGARTVADLQRVINAAGGQVCR